MSISIYFHPSDAAIEALSNKKEHSLAVFTDVNNGSNFPDLDEVNLAFFGVFESRLSKTNPEMSANGMEVIREYLYSLFPNNYKPKIADLGNILPGETVGDTHHAIEEVVFECIQHKVVPVLIGGSQELTYAMYKAYQKMEQIVNLAAIDPKFDLGEIEDDLSDENYLSKIILHKPSYLFNFCNLGHQSYLIDNVSEDLMDNMYFDMVRLGELQRNITQAEYMLRYTDVLSVDMNAVRYSECKASSQSLPNGFYGEEICQLMRYAGASDKLSSIGLFNYSPEKDEGAISAQLIAQMLWCFIDGYYNRKPEKPNSTAKGFQKFIVPIKDAEYKLVFFKSEKTDRWWLEVPFPSKRQSKYERHQLVPCAYEHYQIACKDEMPDIWWKTFQKLG